MDRFEVAGDIAETDDEDDEDEGSASDAGAGAGASAGPLLMRCASSALLLLSMDGRVATGAVAS